MPFVPGGNSIDEDQFLKKADYDPDGDKIVEKASSVEDGEGNSKTADEIISHIDNDAIHHQIDDSSASANTLWSSEKVSNELGNKADITHIHDDRYYTESEIDTKLSGKADVSHTHGWDEVSKAGSKLEDLYNVNVDSSTVSNGQVLTYKNGNWIAQDTNSGTEAQTRFTDVSGAARNDENSFSVENSSTNANIFVPGRPLRYKSNQEDEWIYGIVKTYNEGIVTIMGGQIPDPLGYLQYGVPELVITKNIFIPENPLTRTGESDDLCTGGTAEGTSYNSYHPYTNAIDDDTSTYWGAGPGHYLQYSWDKAKVVNKYRFLLKLYKITGWKFEGSNDGSNWDLLDEKTNQSPATNAWNEYVISNSTPYKYYKFTVTSIQFGHTYIPISELEFKYFQEGDKYELTTGRQFVWEYSTAHLVGVRARLANSPSGGNTVFNIGKNDWQNFIFANPISFSDNNWVESDNSLDIGKYTFQKGDRVFVNVTDVAFDYGGGKLELQFIFVLDGLDV